MQSRYIFETYRLHVVNSLRSNHILIFGQIDFCTHCKIFFREFARNLIMHFCLETAISCLTACNILNCWAPQHVWIFVKKIKKFQCFEADSRFIVFTTDVLYYSICTFMYFATRCKKYFLIM